MTRLATFAVAVAGLAIASYLTIVHYAGAEPVCAIAHGCATVQKSSYAELIGVPVALLGLLGYAAILGSLFRDTETTRSITALLALCGLAFSAWLTYAEVFELNAICVWCVGSAVCMSLLAALATTRLLRAPTP
ncbi:putative membrane protein [Solirubrobacter pauli]|uniref:Putative membrane protein n=1 Tax=Solirubrobacter pauli TaxID=166793 RepID=A0A660LD70_9ACTN|nr:vitamin K epoxide reductase family protein [Solirubrobacter pauli]RKQ93008.1 putative membrane protein [Solirubrobacter pauli]